MTPHEIRVSFFTRRPIPTESLERDQTWGLGWNQRELELSAAFLKGYPSVQKLIHRVCDQGAAQSLTS